MGETQERVRGMRLDVDEIDGRPLYQYRVSLHSKDITDLGSIEIRELQLKNPNAPDHKLVEHLALVAAARFASLYDGDDLTWEPISSG